jgi:hypothetical protein
MATKIRFALLCVLVLAVPAGISLARGNDETAPVAGRILVLENERTLEGAIDRQGDQYRVRRAVGELLVPAHNVLKLCNSLDEAYSFLRSRANLRDPDEHLRLAQWCLQHARRNQAISEVSEAVELRPDRADTRRLLENLKRCAPLKGNGNSHDAAVKPSAADAETAQNQPAVNTESLSLFVTRVQPILMNACASCHATGRGGRFKLLRTYEAGLTNRKTTYQNLAAVLSEINIDQPQASLLLNKSVSVHGDMPQPALKNRDTAAYRALTEWVRVTTENNLRSQGSGTFAMGAVPAVQRPMSVESALPKVESSHAETAKASAEIEPARFTAATPTNPGQPSTQSPPEQKAMAQPPPPPADPFDPVIFNQQFHPQPKK